MSRLVVGHSRVFVCLESTVSSGRVEKRESMIQLRRMMFVSFSRDELEDLGFFLLSGTAASARRSK